jgi:hypothetical protein
VFLASAIGIQLLQSKLKAILYLASFFIVLITFWPSLDIDLLLGKLKSYWFILTQVLDGLQDL